MAEEKTCSGVSVARTFTGTVPVACRGYYINVLAGSEGVLWRRLRVYGSPTPVIRGPLPCFLDLRLSLATFVHVASPRRIMYSAPEMSAFVLTMTSFVVRSLGHIIYTVPQTRSWLHSAAEGHGEFEPRVFAIELVHFSACVTSFSLHVDEHLLLLVCTCGSVAGEGLFWDRLLQSTRWLWISALSSLAYSAVVMLAALFSQSPDTARIPVLVLFEINLLVAIVRTGLYLKLSYESDCRKWDGKERLRYWTILFKVVTLRQLDDNDGKSTILLGLHMILKVVAASVGLAPSFQKPAFYFVSSDCPRPLSRAHEIGGLPGPRLCMLRRASRVSVRVLSSSCIERNHRRWVSRR